MYSYSFYKLVVKYYGKILFLTLNVNYQIIENCRLIMSIYISSIYSIVGETSFGWKLNDINFVCVYKADQAGNFVQLKDMLQSVNLFIEGDGDTRPTYAAARMLKNEI